MISRCPECKKDELVWKNWGEVRTAEERGVEVKLKAVCKNCRAVIVSNEIEVGEECDMEEKCVFDNE